MIVLHIFLKKRHGTHPAGNRVSIKTTIEGLHLMAITHSFSQRVICYSTSSCGSTAVHDGKYLSYFDDFGNATCK